MTTPRQFFTRLIDKQDDLDAFLRDMQTAPVLALDTEFVRESTYYPQLCLVQVAGLDQAVAIDALAPDIDLQPLWDCIQNTRVVKIMHSARQDLEIIWHLSGKLPAPLFDTQIAGTVLGMGEQAGYEAMILSTLNRRLDKSSRYSDWSRRPLSPEQLDYAIGDVTHLLEAYEVLVERLDTQGRRTWVAEEMAHLSDPNLVNPPPEEAWQRLKLRNDKSDALLAAQELAAWREREARRRDLPRNRVVRDEILVALASQRPRSIKQLSNTRGLTDGQIRNFGDALIEAIHRAAERPKEETPKLKKRRPLTSMQSQKLEILRMLLRMCAEGADVTPRTLASPEALSDWVRNPDLRPVPEFLTGWRYELFGEAAERLLRGELWIGFVEGQVEFRKL